NVESGLPRLLADHVTALADQDGTALEPIAARFDELGMWLVAAEASAHASAAHRRAGNARAAAHASARSRAWAARCEGAHTPALDLASPLQSLSRRESEVARLAGSGRTNAEIAERLVLSVRTVESHLYQVFAKLGVERRDELEPLIGGADGTNQ
ncbi:MAG: helix-turn-helix domain-containing protein, partial [Nocardioidaceae bacterium]